MRMLDAVIEGRPLAPPPVDLRPIFDADRKADDVIQRTDELVYEGLTNGEILQRMSGEVLSDETRRRISLRARKRSAVVSDERRTVRLLRTLAGEPVEEGAAEEPVIPGMDELNDLSDEEAFQQIALEVPRLLVLRDVLGPQPAPVPTDLPLREFMRQRRNVRKGPSGASQRAWESRVRQVVIELRRLVGPGASHGSELVRSDIALFKCAQVLLPIGSDRPSDDGGAAP